MRPALFALEPEQAHRLTLSAIDRVAGAPLLGAVAGRLLAGPALSDPFELMGLSFPNRIGLAAGLDKDARHVDGLASLGFGFLELGTVTPEPQPGNPSPRLFRLPAAAALVNRFGFNNEGIDRFIENVRRSRTWRRGRRGSAAAAAPGEVSPPASPAATGGIRAGAARFRPVIGLNIGKNASTRIERATDDYLTCLRRAMPVADYVTINISSPNTRNLRQLQAGRELEELLGAVDRERATLVAAGAPDVPLLVKIAPDLDDDQIEVIAALLERFSIDGVIATNTTLSRAAVSGLRHADEAGGLSGRPVFEPSNRVIRALRSFLGPRFPIIGAGGVMSAEDAVAKVRCGADLVQIYTGLIYHGPALVGECAAALRRAGRGDDRIDAVTGRVADRRVDPAAS